MYAVVNCPTLWSHHVLLLEAVVALGLGQDGTGRCRDCFSRIIKGLRDYVHKECHVIYAFSAAFALKLGDLGEHDCTCPGLKST